MPRSSAAALPDRASADLATPDGLTRAAFPAMGTRIEVLVPVGAERLVDEVRALFERWQATLTRFSPESELSRLNANAGRDVPVNALLFSVVGAALRAAAATDGLFDPLLLGQLVSLGYDRTFDEVRAHAASTPSVKAVAGWPGGAWRRVVLDPTDRTIRLPSGAGLDLGGIAKGMAVDAALALLEAAGCRDAAVDAGGDLAVIGAAGGDAGWPVRIELPAGDRVLRVHEGALATSGISRRHWRTGDREVHHLLDPRAGLPAQNGLWSATVAAPTCESAEVGATAAFVLGPDDGARWLDEHDLDGLFVLADGRQIEAGPWAEAPA